MKTIPVAAAIVMAVALLGGCGGGDQRGSSGGATMPRPPASVAFLADPRIRAAEDPTPADFPRAEGRTIQQLAAAASPGPQLALATSVLVTGTDRLGYGLLDRAGSFIYGRSAVYVASSPTAPARGPYLAPLDPMVTPPPFQSKTVSSDRASVRAIYGTRIPFARPGQYVALVLATTRSGPVAAGTTVTVQSRSSIPDLGARPPLIHTPTAASVHGALDKIDTRLPHDDMHRADFADVIGERPVALLFATPALCQSRTCGPVTDIAVQLEHEFGDRMTFIHNEVYVDNDPRKGYRPQLSAFHLKTEPWLFTFTRDGRVAARLEGAFGVNEFRQAIQAALR